MRRELKVIRFGKLGKIKNAYYKCGSWLDEEIQMHRKRNKLLTI